MSRAASIETLLRTAFKPEKLVVRNDSASHHGHAGDDGSGESHFTVQIIAAHFIGLSRLQRERAVQSVLAPLWAEGLHALSIKALTPDEAKENNFTS